MSDTTPYGLPQAHTRLRTVAEVEQARAAFEAFVASTPDPDTFKKELRSFISVLDLLPDCDPQSMGMSWLEHNISTFHTLMWSQDVEQFLRSCFDSEFITHVLYMPALFWHIDITARKQFVEDLLERHTPHGLEWNNTVQTVCYGFDFGKYLLERLQKTSANNPFFREVVRGCGKKVLRISEEPYTADWVLMDRDNSIWGQLSYPQFVQMVEMIIDKQPELMFAVGSYTSPSFRQMVEARLMDFRLDVELRQKGFETVARLFERAADTLTSLKGISYDSFKQLPVKVRIRLLKKVKESKLPCSILFIAELAIDRNNYQNFFAEFAEVCMRVEVPRKHWSDPLQFNSTVSITEYVELRELCEHIARNDAEEGFPAHHTAVINSIDEAYRTALMRDKHVHFGTLVEGSYPRKKRSGGTERRTRLTVQIEAFTSPRHTYEYVQDEFASRVPDLKVGDEVAFPRHDNTLIHTSPSKTVSATNFTLINRPSSVGPRSPR